MTQPPNIALAEVLADLQTVRDQLRDMLPVIINAAARDRGWPDSMLGDVAASVAEGVGRLDAAYGLVERLDLDRAADVSPDTELADENPG